MKPFIISRPALLCLIISPNQKTFELSHKQETKATKPFPMLEMGSVNLALISKKESNLGYDSNVVAILFKKEEMFVSSSQEEDFLTTFAKVGLMTFGRGKLT